MRSTPDFTGSRLVQGAALVLAAAGVLTLYLVGVPGFPTIPPGPIILGLAGILVLATRWRVMLIVGLVAAAFVAVGGLLEGSVWGRLADPADLGPFLGALLQYVGLVVALVSGAVAVKEAYGTVGAARTSGSASRATSH
jgi:hypothetical protein